MPPAPKVTKDDILRVSLALVRGGGIDAVNARAVAAMLSCSTQPIFSNYPTMEHLKTAVVEKATELYRGCLDDEVQTGKWPPYKAMGMGYIRFAKEEPELFKLLFLGQKQSGSPDQQDWQDGVTAQMDVTHMAYDEAERFHFEMWTCVHGIATMVATSYMPLEMDLISEMLTDVYQGLRSRFAAKEEETK